LISKGDGAVIGTFVVSTNPPSDAVSVQLYWRDDGVRYGIISLPPEQEVLIDAGGYPSVESPIELEGAISYAVYLCLKLHRPLVLTGDMTAWHPDWGPLHFMTASDRSDDDMLDSELAV
jgi:hypothetical protein